MEIERKWHMLRPPELPPLTHMRIAQSYLSLTPELRIRKYEDLMREGGVSYDLTIKSEGTMVREEITKELTEAEYRSLSGMLDGRAPIVKERFTYAFRGYVLEFSVVDAGLDSGFTYAEVEFPSVEEASAFAPPEWFGEETTEQEGVRMKAYWQQTRPSLI